MAKRTCDATARALRRFRGSIAARQRNHAGPPHVAGGMHRIVVVILALLAALGGALVTAANRWAAEDPGSCRDTFTGIAAMCVLPESPTWALLLGALLPGCAVIALIALWSRRQHSTTTGR